MCVRPSTALYGGFGLGTGRSPGFGPAGADSHGSMAPYALFTLGFPPAPRPAPLNLAGTRSSPDRSTKSTQSRACGAPAACGRRVSGSLSLPSRGPFHLSFTVLCSIGHWVVFSLAGWSPRLPTGFHVPRGTLDPAAPMAPPPTGLSPSTAGLPRAVPPRLMRACAVLNPGVRCTPVWAPPVPLAATPGIDVSFQKRFSFFSSGYLDVSVRRVPPAGLCVRPAAAGVLPRRVSPFGHPWITARVRLPMAFRSLPRPSSAPSAKASALRLSLLNPSLRAPSVAPPGPLPYKGDAPVPSGTAARTLPRMCARPCAPCPSCSRVFHDSCTADRW